MVNWLDLECMHQEGVHTHSIKAGYLLKLYSTYQNSYLDHSSDVSTENLFVTSCKDILKGVLVCTFWQFHQDNFAVGSILQGAIQQGAILRGAIQLGAILQGAIL